MRRFFLLLFILPQFLLAQKLTVLKNIPERSKVYPGFLPFHGDNNTWKRWLPILLTHTVVLKLSSFPAGLSLNKIRIHLGQVGKTLFQAVRLLYNSITSLVVAAMRYWSKKTSSVQINSSL
jgi:hypothetical protein